jgi:hypothetical protein
MQTEDEDTYTQSEDEVYQYYYSTDAWIEVISTKLHILPMKGEQKTLDLKEPGHYKVQGYCSGKLNQWHLISSRGGGTKRPSTLEFKALERLSLRVEITRRDDGSVLGYHNAHFVRDHAYGASTTYEFDISPEIAKAGGAILDGWVTLGASLKSRMVTFYIARTPPKKSKPEVVGEYRQKKKDEGDFELTRSEFAFKKTPKKTRPFLNLPPDLWELVIRSSGLNQTDCRRLSVTCKFFYHNAYKFLSLMKMTMRARFQTGEASWMLKYLSLKCPNLESLELDSGGTWFLDRHFNFLPKNLRSLSMTGFTHCFYPASVHQPSGRVPEHLSVLTNLEHLKVDFQISEQYSEFLPKHLLSLDCPFMQFDPYTTQFLPLVTLPASLTSLKTTAGGFTLKNLKNLRKLSAPFSAILNSEYDGLLESLKILSFENDPNGKKLIAFLQECPKLRSLSLPGAPEKTFSVLPFGLKKLKIRDLPYGFDPAENFPKMSDLPPNLEFFYWCCLQQHQNFSLQGFPDSLQTLILDFRWQPPETSLCLSALPKLRNLFLISWQSLKDVKGIPEHLEFLFVCDCPGLTTPAWIGKNIPFLRSHRITSLFLPTRMQDDMFAFIKSSNFLF